MQVNEIAAHLTTKKKDLDEILEAYLGVHPRCSALKAELGVPVREALSDPKTLDVEFPFGLCRLDANTMFQVRKWERFQFMIGYEHQQVLPLDVTAFNCI